MEYGPSITVLIHTIADLEIVQCFCIVIILRFTRHGDFTSIPGESKGTRTFYIRNAASEIQASVGSTV